MQAYVSPVLMIAVIVFFSISLKERFSVAMLIYLVAILLYAGYKYFIYLKRPMEIEVNGMQIKIKNLLGKVTEFTFNDLTDIEITKRRELYLTINENKIRGLNTFKNFDRFVEDAKKKNPNINFWGFSK